MQSYLVKIPDEFQTLKITPETTLEAALDYEFVIDELKHQNKEFLDFLLDDTRFSRLVSYAIEIPPDLGYDPREPHKDERRNKFPLVAADILSLEIERISSKILGIPYNEPTESSNSPEKNGSFGSFG
jgi:hypothetical protein